MYAPLVMCFGELEQGTVAGRDVVVCCARARVCWLYCLAFVQLSSPLTAFEMRAVFAVAFLAVIATAACPAAPQYDPFGGLSTCNLFTGCRTTLCTCIGGSLTSCKAASSKTCAEINTCYNTFSDCLGANDDTLQTACPTLYTAAHTADMMAAVSGYAGSSLQTSCMRYVCGRVNGTSFESTCTFGTNYSNYCKASVVGTGSPPLPPTVRVVTVQPPAPFSLASSSYVAQCILVAFALLVAS